MKKFVFAFATFALAVASAGERYHVKFYVPAEIGGQVIKPGEYSLEMKGDRAVLKSDSGKVETEARLENGGEKFKHTVVSYVGEESSARLNQIRIGGTSKTIVFATPQMSGN